MKPIGWIYLTTNLVNGKIYVGKHEILENKKLNATYIGSGRLFKRALKKYGEENFKRKILRLCYTLHELRIWEHVYIVKYKSYIRNIGYNIAKGDVNTSEYNPAKLPEVRKKISESKKGQISGFRNKKHSEISKMKLSISANKRFESYDEREKLRQKAILQFKTKGHPMLGRKMSEISKEKNSLSHLGQIPWNKGKKWSEDVKNKIRESKKNISDETRQKIREKHLGKRASEETRKKMSEIRRGRESPAKGIKWTKEQRDKLSEIRRKFRHSDDTKNLLSKLNSGSNNPNYGKRYINNGFVNKLINKNESLPDGWKYGCIQKHKN
jgi:group I intron endonuclease